VRSTHDSFSSEANPPMHASPASGRTSERLRNAIARRRLEEYREARALEEQLFDILADESDS
jgi:hypothetical protein